MQQRSNRSDRDFRYDRAGDGEPQYFARSVNEAAFIYLQEIPFLNVRGRPGNAQYVFADKDNVARNAALEYAADARVSARLYSVALAQLKRQAIEILGRAPGYQGKNPVESGLRHERRTAQGDTAFAEQFAAAMGEQ
jgi:hypothetical protein